MIWLTGKSENVTFNPGFSANIEKFGLKNIARTQNALVDVLTVLSQIPRGVVNDRLVHICIYHQHNKVQTLWLKDKVSTLLYLFKAKIITLLTTRAPVYEYHKWSPLLYIFVIYHLVSQCPNIWVKFHKGAFWRPELSGLSCL